MDGAQDEGLWGLWRPTDAMKDTGSGIIGG